MKKHFVLALSLFITLSATAQTTISCPNLSGTYFSDIDQTKLLVAQLDCSKVTITRGSYQPMVFLPDGNIRQLDDRTEKSYFKNQTLVIEDTPKNGLLEIHTWEFNDSFKTTLAEGLKVPNTDAQSANWYYSRAH
jgi:hypothetical protein